MVSKTYPLQTVAESMESKNLAERFIQSALRERAYARAYKNSDQRADELPHWLHHYNWHKPHVGIKGKTPVNRSGAEVNNLRGLSLSGCCSGQCPLKISIVTVILRIRGAAAPQGFL